MAEELHQEEEPDEEDEEEHMSEENLIPTVPEEMWVVSVVLEDDHETATLGLFTRRSDATGYAISQIQRLGAGDDAQVVSYGDRGVLVSAESMSGEVYQIEPVKVNPA